MHRLGIVGGTSEMIGRRQGFGLADARLAEAGLFSVSRAGRKPRSIVVPTGFVGQAPVGAPHAASPEPSAALGQSSRRRALGLLVAFLAACNGRPSVTPDLGRDQNLGDLVLDLPGADGEQGCINPPDLNLDAPGDTADTRGAPLDTLSDGPHLCPLDMVQVSAGLCMDRYEASRPDATATDQGTQTGAAQSKAGVIPWHSVALSAVEAKAACAAAGKRLCSPTEWQQSCSGPQLATYAYGNTYEPATCNGIDTYCLCGAGQACAGVSPCPYPHCFSQPPPAGTTACGAYFHVTPTGSFSGCVSGTGVFDLNGNVWELVETTDGLDHFRGGAYNCGDSELLHRCDYDATWGPSAQGFRCCADALAPG